MNTQKEIAAALLNIGAVGFIHGEPIKFKSGILSPVYVDNRTFPFHPQEWKKVIQGFVELLSKHKVRFDVIAGIETAGIPHSAALGYELNLPSVFVRKQIKDHGTKSKIEGGGVTYKTVVLIEDHVTTGSSSLAGIEALRQSEATVTDCLSITSYEFDEAKKDFATAKVKLHTLTSFPIILSVALEKGVITSTLKKSVENWLSDPWKWSDSHQKI